MKKNALLLTAFLGIAYLTLKSDSSGPGGNYTGSKGGSPGCITCHGSSATTGIKLGIELDSAGIPVTQYVGGKTYTIKLADTNTLTTSTLPMFGFEFSAVKGSGSSATQAGTFGTLPAGTSTHTSSGLTIWGHNSKLSPASGTGAAGTVYSVSVTWTAPAAGSGTVTMFSVMNDVNNDGNDNTSDKWNAINVSFPERTVSSTGVRAISSDIDILPYPNPTSGDLHLAINNADAGDHKVSILDMAGKTCIERTILVSGSHTEATLPTASLAPGIYHLVARYGDHPKVVTFVKQ